MRMCPWVIKIETKIITYYQTKEWTKNNLNASFCCENLFIIGFGELIFISLLDLRNKLSNKTLKVVHKLNKLKSTVSI